MGRSRWEQFVLDSTREAVKSYPVITLYTGILRLFLTRRQRRLIIKNKDRLLEMTGKD